MSDDAVTIVRVLFQRIDPGDRRKFEAQSNDAPSGGGARDLRFRPAELFLPFFQRVFPQTRTQTRKGGERIEIQVGSVTWAVQGQERNRSMEIWPPTSARRGEIRIAQIADYGFHELVQDDPRGRRSVFMLFQQRNEIVRIHFTTESSLRNDDWDPAIKNFAAEWFRTQRKSAFLDLETGERFPR